MIMVEYLNFTSQNIGWFNQRKNDDTLIVRPKFQRNVVWTDKQRSFLIDSILNGYPIPELYIQEVTNAEGISEYIVVDGQQRITSFLKFIAGEFPIDESETIPKWAGLYFSDLSEEDKKKFYGYKFIVREHPEMSDSELRSIFTRINKNNVSLNEQELRQALYTGDFITTINRIADKAYWGQLGIFTSTKIRRMQDAEYISELAIAMLNGYQNKKDKLDKYYEAYERSFDKNDVLEDSFDSIAKEIISIFPSLRGLRWKKLTDFYTLFLTFYELKDYIPFSSDNRKMIGRQLEKFANAVTKILSFEDLEVTDDEGLSSDIDLDLYKKYAANVRASTDIKSRKNRQEALTEYLKKKLDI